MQTVDFVALATRVAAGVEGIRACLVLSRDGLTLGAHPADEEERAKEGWNRLQAVGDAQRGFLDLGHEIIAVVRRGAYVGVALAAPDVRPGLVLDALDTHLHAAEEERSRQTPPASEPAARPEPPRRRRPVRHSAAARRREEASPSQEPAERSTPEPAPVIGAADRRVVDLASEETSGGRWGARLRKLAGSEADREAAEKSEAAAPAIEEAVAGPAEPEPAEESDRPEEAEAPPPAVDRSALAREFGRLLSGPGRGE